MKIRLSLSRRLKWLHLQWRKARIDEWNPPREQRKCDGHQEDPENYVAGVVRPISTASPQNPKARIYKRYSKKKRQYTKDKGIFWLTFVMCVLIFVYTVYTRRLVVGSEETSAAQIALMVEANKINHMSFEAVQRAFVTNIRLALTDTGNNTPGFSRWVIGPVIENSGNTPTINLRAVARTGIRALGDHTPIDDPDNGFAEDEAAPMRQYIHSRFSVSPHAQTHVVDSGLTKETHADMVKQRWEMIYAGAIRYRDVFPGTIEHVTKYCYSMMAVGVASDGSSVPVSARCPYWNCTDEQCEDDKHAYEAALVRAPGKTGPAPKR